MRKYIAIIPARAGSKGVLGKNLKLLSGLPLIGYSIQAASDSNIFSEIIVSSDGEDILEYSESLGAHTVKRPEKLSTDSSRSEDAVHHVLASTGLDKEDSIHFVLLQPTSPLRTQEHIKESIVKYERLDVNALLSAVKVDHPPQKTLIKKGSDRCTPLISWDMLSAPRQSLPEAYRVNGAIYIRKAKDFISTHSFYCEDLAIYEMKKEDSIDIDRQEDFELAERILKNRT